MERTTRPAVYREVVDELVRRTRHGWKLPPEPSFEDYFAAFMPDRQAVESFKARLSPADADLLYVMLANSYYGGFHDTLVVLYEHAVAPFDDGYEGDPFHDYVGRLTGDWSWPE
jgi:hypothetical protein